jgi:subtilisin family serine protease
MDRFRGQPDLAIGLLDGPVFLSHPDLARQKIHDVTGKAIAGCSKTNSLACMHGTWVAGILGAKRGSAAPAICPDCTLLVRPIFREFASNGDLPTATPNELAAAVVEIVDAGARVVNISAALKQQTPRDGQVLTQALDYAAQRGAIIVAAAGNHGVLGSSPITQHPWVIPVAGYDSRGRPLNQSNLGSSIGRRGLGAFAGSVTSLGADGAPHSFGGTSAAAPFVTGAIALIWSEFSDAPAIELKLAIARSGGRLRRTVVPPLLDAWGAYHAICWARNRKQMP